MIKDLVDRDYSFNKDWKVTVWKWNLDEHDHVVKNISIDGVIDCTACAAKATMEITFELTITLRSLKSLAIAVEGDLIAQVGADYGFSKAYEKEAEKLVTTIKLPNIEFTIGPVPFVINTEIPILIGYDVTAQAKARVAAIARAGGSFKFGIQYDPKSGFNWIHIPKFTHSGSLDVLGDASVGVIVYVLPTVQVEIDYIGGPNLGIKPYVEAVASFNPLDTKDPCHGLRGKVGVNLGLQVSLGARIDIEILGHSLLKKEVKPATLVSLKYPIYSACIKFNLLPLDSKASNDKFLTMPFRQQGQTWEQVFADLGDPTPNVAFYTNSTVFALPAEDVPCAEGNTWVGFITKGPGTAPECKQYPSVRALSLQVIETTVTSTGPRMGIVVSVNDAHVDHPQNDSSVCVLQSLYNATVQERDDSLIFTKSTTGPIDLVNYAECYGNSCTCTAHSTQIPSRFVGKTDKDFKTIVLEDSLKCTKATLNRIAAHTTGAASVQKYGSSLTRCGLTH